MLEISKRRLMAVIPGLAWTLVMVKHPPGIQAVTSRASLLLSEASLLLERWYKRQPGCVRTTQNSGPRYCRTALDSFYRHYT